MCIRDRFHTTQIEHRANVICQRRANKTACQRNANVGLWNDCYLGNVFQPHFTTSLQRPINEKYRFYNFKIHNSYSCPFFPPLCLIGLLLLYVLSRYEWPKWNCSLPRSRNEKLKKKINYGFHYADRLHRGYAIYIFWKNLPHSSLLIFTWFV